MKYESSERDLAPKMLPFWVCREYLDHGVGLVLQVIIIWSMILYHLQFFTNNLNFGATP